MKIVMINNSDKIINEVSISSAICSSITDAGYGSGSLERVGEIAEKAAERLGNVIEILFNKGLLTKDELSNMLSYHYNIIEDE